MHSHTVYVDYRSEIIGTGIKEGAGDQSIEVREPHNEVPDAIGAIVLGHVGLRPRSVLELKGFSQNFNLYPFTAGKVTIKGECVDCSHGHTTTTTTHKPSTGKGNGGRTTAKPKPKSSPPRRPTSSEEDDDDLAGGWSLHQSAGGSQYIGRRSKRQGQYIDLGGSGGRGGGGGWSGGVTTYDSRGYPGGTLVRNSDCVGCNIRG